MSTLSTRKIKHDSSSVDNITLDSSGRVGVQQASPNVPLEVSGNWRLGTNTSGANLGGLGGSFNASNNIYSVYCRDRSDTNWNDLWVESKTLRLKVNGGDTAIYMDQSGRVTMPYQPSFFVLLTNAQSVSTGGQKINFDTVRHNTGTHWSTSTYRFTAPVAGKYLFNATVSFNSLSGGTELQLYKNGGAYSGKYDTSTGSTGQSMSVIWDLAANDYVEVYTYSGVTRTYTGRSDAWTSFSGQLIG